MVSKVFIIVLSIFVYSVTYFLWVFPGISISPPTFLVCEYFYLCENHISSMVNNLLIPTRSIFADAIRPILLLLLIIIIKLITNFNKSTQFGKLYYICW